MHYTTRKINHITSFSFKAQVRHQMHNIRISWEHLNKHDFDKDQTMMNSSSQAKVGVEGQRRQYGTSYLPRPLKWNPQLKYYSITLPQM